MRYDNRQLGGWCFLAFVWGGLAGCARDDSDHVRGMLESLAEAGVEVVYTAATAPENGVPELLVDVEEVVFESTGMAEFGDLRSVIVTEREAIIPLDVLSHEIRVFSVAGELTYRFGRRGRGPGEFLSVTGVALINPDTILVSDFLSKHVSAFLLDGTFLGREPLLIGLDYEQRSLVNRRILGAQFDRLLLAQELGTRRVDTLVSLSPVPVEILKPALAWLPHTSGSLIYGRTDEPLLYIVDSFGILERVIVLPYTSRLVTRAEAHRLIAAERTRREMANVPGYLSVPPPSVAEIRPLYARMRPGFGDTFLINRFPEPGDLQDEWVITEMSHRQVRSAHWDVFSRTGQWTASIQIPSNIDVFSSAGDRLYGIRFHSDGRQSIVRLRLRGSEEQR